ncbi:MAG TPA: hypothetical protein VNH44_04900 [Micropepsaceae bacterium]|nr:hypothetical protein [Micropepsaceae bacterium]
MALAGRPFFFRERGVQNAAHIRPAQTQRVRAGKFASERIAEQNARSFTRQTIAVAETSVGQRPRRHIQRQPMGRVRRAKGAARDPKTNPIKFVTLNDGDFGRVSGIGRVRVVREVVFQAQALRWHPAKGTALRQSVLPQFTRRARVRIDAGHSDDGDGGVHG